MKRGPWHHAVRMLMITATFVAAGLAVNAGSAPAEEPAPEETVPQATSENGRIAFASSRDGNLEIYSMEPDGSDVRRLTDDPASDGAPAYSPDGTKVAFSRYRDGVRELFVVGADGSGLRQLTDHPDAEPGHEYWDHDPAFSPDGSKIAFSRAERSVYVMGADGSDPVRLAEGYDPAFSPDGSKIAYSRDGDLWTMDADGGGQERLTGGPERTEGEPTWSPDGGGIAYQSSYYDWDLMYTFSEVRVVGADGTGDRLLVDGPDEEWDPSWSPDGAWIAFSWEGPDSGALVYAVRPDGTDPTRLTDNPDGYDGAPSWGAAPGANSAPRVTRVWPAPGSNTRDRTPTIRATVRDAQDDLVRADIRLHVDGRKTYRFSYDRESDRLSYAAGRRLSYGAHAVKITAADTEGLRAAKSWRFHVRR